LASLNISDWVNCRHSLSQRRDDFFRASDSFLAILTLNSVSLALRRVDSRNDFLFKTLDLSSFRLTLWPLLPAVCGLTTVNWGLVSMTFLLLLVILLFVSRFGSR
jgi:hypothetical protein